MKTERTEPLPCAFKRGRKREVCGGTPKVERTGFGDPRRDFYARCQTCKGATGFGFGPDGALAEWNRWMRIEAMLDD